jgi:two-component system KDP operon response regulator KdpE
VTVLLDIPARRIMRGSEEIHLTPIEFRLLAALLNNPGKVLTQRQLLNQVWGPNAVEHSHYCINRPPGSLICFLQGIKR